MLTSTFVLLRNALLMNPNCTVEEQVGRAAIVQVVMEVAMDLQLALTTTAPTVMAVGAGMEAGTVAVYWEETMQTMMALVVGERSQEAKVDQAAEVEAKTGAEDPAAVRPAPALRQHSMSPLPRLLPLLPQGSATCWLLRSRTRVRTELRQSVTIQRTWPLLQPPPQMPLRRLPSVVFLSL
jgi:hypothetical protein